MMVIITFGRGVRYPLAIEYMYQKEIQISVVGNPIFSPRRVCTIKNGIIVGSQDNSRKYGNKGCPQDRHFLYVFCRIRPFPPNAGSTAPDIHGNLEYPTFDH